MRINSLPELHDIRLWRGASTISLREPVWVYATKNVISRRHRQSSRLSHTGQHSSSTGKLDSQDRVILHQHKILWTWVCMEWSRFASASTGPRKKKDLLPNFPTFEQLISLLFHLQRLFNFGHDCSDWIRSGDDSGTKRLQPTSLKASRGKSDAVNRLKG